MKTKDMSVNAPIMVRVFKEEAVLEVWKQKRNGRCGTTWIADMQMVWPVRP